MDYLNRFTGGAGCQGFTVPVTLLFEQKCLVSRAQK